jgi:hypothetical protein
MGFSESGKPRGLVLLGVTGKGNIPFSFLKHEGVT